MENSALVLWIPIILISLASIVKLLNKNTSTGKPWIRIEKDNDNE